LIHAKWIEEASPGFFRGRRRKRHTKRKELHGTGEGSSAVTFLSSDNEGKGVTRSLQKLSQRHKLREKSGKPGAGPRCLMTGRESKEAVASSAQLANREVRKGRTASKVGTKGNNRQDRPHLWEKQEVRPGKCQSQEKKG